MGTLRFKQFFCLLLAAIMLATSSHHILCETGYVRCPPCQPEGGDEDSCPACSVSHSIAKTGMASAKYAVPVVVLCLLSDDFVTLLLTKPAAEEPTLYPLDFVSPQKHHYLRDLVQSIPIRGPSMTA